LSKTERLQRKDDIIVALSYGSYEQKDSILIPFKSTRTRYKNRQGCILSAEEQRAGLLPNNSLTGSLKMG